MSTVRPPRLRPGLRVDRVGEELLVLDGSSHRVHRLRGPAADVVRRLRDGVAVPFGDPEVVRVVAALRSAGVVEGGVSRRRALGAAAAAGLGIMTLSLPGAAMASTHIDGSGSSFSVSGGTAGVPSGAFAGSMAAAEDYTYMTFTSDSTAVVSGNGTIDILLISGGGGGAGGISSSVSYGGGGGAAGAVFLNRDFSVTEGSFSFVVGAGGDGGAADQSGGLGGSTYVAGIGTTQGGGIGGSGSQGGAAYAAGGGIGRSVDGGAGGGGGGGGTGTGVASGVAGLDATDGEGGAGGAGPEITNFFATTVRCGGGGGGGGSTGGGAGGAGGGGAGSSEGAGAGATAYGSGGGGGASGASGGDGAPGVIVIRYPTA